jgi:hypothetical protein
MSISSLVGRDDELGTIEEFLGSIEKGEDS